MASGAVAVEKSAEELRKEIEELRSQEREMTQRLYPRGFRRGGFGPGRGRFNAAGDGGAPRNRGVVRPAADSEDQPPAKRRIASEVVKKEEELNEDNGPLVKDVMEEDPPREAAADGERKVHGGSQGNGNLRRDRNFWTRKNEIDKELPEPTKREPRVADDPKLMKRNQRMLGQLLGTLVKFAEEDKKLSSTEAYMRRSDSFRRAEEKAREESERLRQQRAEQNVEKRRRDLILRARIAAKTEQKTMELLFLSWTEHHRKLSNFLRTQAEPQIYYMPAKPLDPATAEQHKEQGFLEWKSARRAELSEYQSHIEERLMANVDKELEQWQNARRRNNLANLQETMDKELETHKLEHGPKTRRIAGSNDDEDDEEITAEDEMDEVIGIHERIDGDVTKLSESGNGSPSHVEIQ